MGPVAAAVEVEAAATVAAEGGARLSDRCARLPPAVAWQSCRVYSTQEVQPGHLQLEQARLGPKQLDLSRFECSHVDEPR